MNFKIIILFFAILNILVFLFATNIFKTLDYNSKKNNYERKLIVINPEKESIKEKPDSVELFPHSDSTIWNAFEDKKEIENEKTKADLNKENVKKEELISDNNIKNSNNEQNINSEDILLDKKKVIDDDNNDLLNDYSYNKTKIAKGNKQDESVGIENFEGKVKNNKEKNIDINEKNNKRFSIQIASLSEKILIPKEWKRLIKIYPKLSSRKYNIKEIKLKNGKTFYRLLILGFNTKDKAQEFCSNILNNKNCIIKIYE